MSVAEITHSTTSEHAVTVQVEVTLFISCYLHVTFVHVHAMYGGLSVYE